MADCLVLEVLRAEAEAEDRPFQASEAAGEVEEAC